MEELPFRYFLRVRYGECDAQKIVFNARWSDYVGLAVDEYLRVLGHGGADAAVEYQLVRQTLEWRGPARYDDILEIRVRTARIGTTSFALGCEFRRADRDEVLARAETIYVHVDAQRWTKAPLPADLRSALEHGAPGRLVDHAGYLAGRANTESLP
jgi:acyl-CoA thioester hydrolase